jgi:hypothetical protein
MRIYHSRREIGGCECNIPVQRSVNLELIQVSASGGWGFEEKLKAGGGGGVYVLCKLFISCMNTNLV